MNLNTKKLILLFTTLFLLSGCNRIFETDQDIQARQALLDLADIQEQFHQEKGHYAKNLIEIEKYNLNYHSGIVYLEIEKADKDSYRAISLAAESVTARVFAFDTEQGGFYEMGEEEVSGYVLGSLNYIRTKKREKRTVDFMSGALVVILLWYGLRIYNQYKTQKAGLILGPFFLAILPLCFTVALLNHINKDVLLTPLLKGLMAGSAAIAVICVLMNVINFYKIPEGEPRFALIGVAVCTIAMGIFITATIIQTYQKYSGPKNEIYFAPNQ